MLPQNRSKRGQASLLTWKNNVRLLITLSVLAFNFMILSRVDAKGLEGAQFASSGSYYATNESDSAEEDRIHVCFVTFGGIQNERNAAEYKTDGVDITLYAPYRYGYQFDGWYTDRAMRKKVTHLPASEKKDYVLYAKWNLEINNRANVQNYAYHSKGRSKDKKTKLLKSLDYSFYDAIAIPGMPSTRENDLLNQYIFSESQAPQGICLTDEFVLITSYSTEDDCMGELMVMDKESGEYMITLGMDENSHLGGIAFDGENVWVCNSHEGTIERISYDFIQQMAYQNKGEVVDAREVVDEYPVKNTPSCITYYGGRLWVATHTLVVTSKMYAYYFDHSSDKLVALSSYKIPSKVQGVAFDASGGVHLSSSYGRSNSSYLYNYTSITSLATSPNRPTLKVEMPPCSEEIDCYNDTLYVMFESAGEKYLEGTDGKGTSLSPIDKILEIPVDELN